MMKDRSGWQSSHDLIILLPFLPSSSAGLNPSMVLQQSQYIHFISLKTLLAYFMLNIHKAREQL